MKQRRRDLSGATAAKSTDFLHVPKRHRNKAANGHDHTAGLILPASMAGKSRHAVPESWADAPTPAIPDEVQAFIMGADDAKGERKHNAYLCDSCKAALHTYERHPGITPLRMSHALMTPGTRCPGQMVSQGYPEGAPPDVLGPPLHEWYRPSAEAMAALTPRIVEHIMRGGLLLRRWEG